MKQFKKGGGGGVRGGGEKKADPVYFLYADVGSWPASPNANRLEKTELQCCRHVVT